MNQQFSTHELKNGVKITIRLIQPDDAEREQNFIRTLSLQSRYFRFMSAISELTSEQLYQFIHNNPPKQMAFVATCNEGGNEVQIGVARYVLSDVNEPAEFAVVVAYEWQGQGIATQLLRRLANYAMSAVIKKIKGFMLSSNRNMYRLAYELGLKIEPSTEDPQIYKISGNLNIL